MQLKEKIYHELTTMNSGGWSETVKKERRVWK